MSGITGGEKVSGVVHHFHAYGDVAYAYPKVDKRFAFTLGVPGIYVVGADFEFERSGYTIVSLKLIVARFLGMLVEIDEAWRDDQTLSVENSFSY